MRTQRRLRDKETRAPLATQSASVGCFGCGAKDGGGSQDGCGINDGSPRLASPCLYIYFAPGLRRLRAEAPALSPKETCSYSHMYKHYKNTKNTKNTKYELWKLYIIQNNSLMFLKFSNISIFETYFL